MKVFIVLALLVAVAVAAPTTTQEPEGCIYNGVEYAAGSSYKADCNTCHCAGNNLAMCTLMACLPGGK
ncbi:hypothetical protein BaRGS_00024728 [Batillaria attramentaria]|uniref:Pacifastin domain-containing protein n=1 Tax=Batillaria attramentaria TaxID=370345 RepID=A0ABD0KA72_9CAEN